MSSLRSRRRARVAQPQTIRRHGCTLTGAQKLAKNDRQGLFLDFTDHSILVRDGTTAANRANSFGLTDGNGVARGPTALLTYTAPSVKMTLGPEGTLRFQAHNLLPVGSEDQGNGTTYSAGGTTNTTGQSGPFGRRTAVLFTGTGSTAICRLASNLTSLVASAIYGVTVRFKRGNCDWVRVAVGHDSTYANSYVVWFDVQNGVVGTSSTSGSGISSGGTSTITSLDSGWYACTLFFTSTATTLNVAIAPAASDGVFTRPDVGSGAGVGVTWYTTGWQIRRMPSDDTYMVTTSAARYALPLEWSSAGVLQGIRVEESRTNTFEYTQNFENAYWSEFDVQTITSGTETAPDGTSTADAVLETATTASHYIANPTSSWGSNIQTFSFWVKPNGRSWVFFQFTGSGVSGTTAERSVWFDITAGTNGAVGTTGSLWSNCRVDTGPNDWKRVSGTITNTGSANQLILGLATADNTASYLGDITKGIFVWGAQREVGSIVSSYIHIPASSSVTRAADDLRALTSQFPASATEFTLFAEYNTVDSLAIILQADLNSAERAYIAQASSTTLDSDAATGGVPQAPLSRSTAALGSTHKGAGAFKANDFALCLNGGAVATDVSGSMPSSIDKLMLGTVSYASTLVLNGVLCKVMYVPRRMTNAELQTLTT